ncbi:MAG: hypothetical protein ACOCWG_01670, partial [bacterium]
MKYFLMTLLIVSMMISCKKENEKISILDNYNLSTNSETEDSQGNIYSVGYIQRPDNQDTRVTKKDKNGKVIWELEHAASETDERAILVSLDEDENPWVVFIVLGGSNNDKYITRKETSPGAFDHVFLNSFGNGGNKQVSVVTRLNPQTGKIEKGTFLTARLSSGKTNSLIVDGIAIKDGKVALGITSGSRPPAA